jgi:hypothetical protein
MSDAKDKLNAFDDNDEIMSWCDRDTYKGSETYVHLHGLYGLAVEFSDEITALRADNERLKEEAEFNYMTGFDAAKNRYCTMVQKLEDENERLRAALKPFAGIKADDGDDFSKWPDMVIIKCEVSVRELKAARAALDGQPAPGKEEA